MMRLDKLLTELGLGTRSQVKDYIKKGLVLVDGVKAKKPEDKVDPDSVTITFQGKDYTYSQNVYYIMNKPAGLITATEDFKEETVMDLFYRLQPEAPKGLSPAGRLDKDTTGLLLITNDGGLIHSLLSPKRHVMKKYFVTLDGPLTAEDVHALEKGVHIGQGEDTAPAQVEYQGGNTCYISISEGKFHQVKRMFFAVGRRVEELKRVSFGPIQLDEKELPVGTVRQIDGSIFS